MPYKKIIKQDGKEYSFTPGQKPSSGLVAKPESSQSPQPTSWLMNTKPQSKIVPSNYKDPSIRKNRQNLTKSIVGMTRG